MKNLLRGIFVGLICVSCGSSSSSKSFSSSGSNNTSSNSTNLTVTISTPSTGLTSRIGASNEASYTIEGTCVDGTSVSISAGTASASGSCSGGNYSINMDFSSLADGNINVTVTITNANGDTGTANLSLVKEAALCSGVAAGTFQSGSGSSGDPYIICTFSQFSDFGTHVAANAATGHHYKIGDHIDGLGGSFNPIPENRFGANNTDDTLDGNNFSISNFVIADAATAFMAIIEDMEGDSEVKDLYIDQVSLPNASSGTFGAAIITGLMEQNASVSNVNISNATINANGMGNSFVGIGGISASLQSSSASITNSSVEIVINNLTIQNKRTGGLVGIIAGTGGTVTNSSTSGSITFGDTSNTGGAIGYINVATGVVISDLSSSINISVNSSSGTGGLIGATIQSNYTFNNLSATGSVSVTAGTPQGIGGLIGAAQGANTVVNNSYATGDVSASAGQYIGGLIGYSQAIDITISESYSTGDVNANQYSSAFVGMANGITLNDCFSSGDVTVNATNANVGGLILEDWGTRNININRSYYAGTMTPNGTGNAYPMIAPQGGGTISAVNSYYDNTLNPTAVVQGSGLTTVEMTDTANRSTYFAGFNFSTTWTDDAATNYPILR